MTSNGVYIGAIGAYALTAIRLDVTGISSGTESWSITCSGAVPPASVSVGTLNVSVPTPLPVTLTTPLPVALPTDTGGNIAVKVGAVASPVPVSLPTAPLTVNVTGAVPTIELPWASCLLTDSTAVTCKGSAGQIVGVVNNSLSSQTATVTCYDNASAASGTVAWNVGPLGVSQQIIFPAPGRPTSNGITCKATATPTGGNIEVQYR